MAYIPIAESARIARLVGTMQRVRKYESTRSNIEWVGMQLTVRNKMFGRGPGRRIGGKMIRSIVRENGHGLESMIKPVVQRLELNGVRKRVMHNVVDVTRTIQSFARGLILLTDSVSMLVVHQVLSHRANGLSFVRWQRVNALPAVRGLS